MAKLGHLYVEVGVRGLAAFHSALQSIRTAVGGVAGAITAPVRMLESAFAGLASPAGLARAAMAAVGIAGAKGIMQLAASAESLHVQFEVLLGSAEAARKMMEDLVHFAATTPYELMELSSVAKQLLAFGVGSEEVVDVLRDLGDIAALSGSQLQDLAQIYGAIKQQGVLTGYTLKMWQIRGIPIVRELAAVLGVAENQVKELTSKGKVGFEHVRAAIKRLTGEGGQFANGMQRLSRTTAGLWSTFTDNIKLTLTAFGEGIIKLLRLKELLSSLISVLETGPGTVKGFIEKIEPAFSAGLDRVLSGFRSLAAIGGSVARELWEPIARVLASIYDGIRSFGQSLAELAKTDLLSTFGSGFLEVVRGAADTVSFLVTTVIELGTAGANAAAQFLASWKDVLAQLVDTVAAAFNTVCELTRGLVSAALDIARTGLEWIGAAITAVTGQSLEQTGEQLRRNVHEWLLIAEFYFENWRLFLSIALERARLFGMNVLECLRAMFVNLGRLLIWFAHNWQDVFTDIWTGTVTIVSNLVTNLKELWTAFWHWVRTGEWTFEWTPLLEGFRSAIREWPELVSPELRATTDELERLYKELDRRMAAFYEEKQKKRAEAVIALEKPTLTAPEAKEEEEKRAATPGVVTPPAPRAGAARIAFVALEALAKQMQEEVGRRLQEKMADATQRAADGIDMLASAVEHGALRVHVMNTVPAVYG